uniref:Uncharacterized protein n=1 Tax=Arundo donax TaxID=35708 RepID=A0A0A9GXS9_ARUDO
MVLISLLILRSHVSRDVILLRRGGFPMRLIFCSCHWKYQGKQDFSAQVLQVP